jgi:flagellar M-ring protein FliF
VSDRRDLLRTFRDIWKQTTLPARVAIVATLVVSVAVIGGVGYWSAQPHFVPLASNLDPATAAEIVSRLEENGIANKLNFSGSGVMVDQGDWNKASLLIGDMIDSTQMNTSPLDSSFLGDPGTREHRLARDLEMRLSRTLMQLKPVENAWVHLGLPEPEPFVRDRKEKTASVIIQLRPNATVTRELARTIIGTVANSVEGLQPANISISDTSGRMYATDGSETGASVASQLEYRQEIERDLASKAETMLETMLGYGRAVVRVTADIDFTELQTETETFDPESRATASEKTENTTGSRESVLAAGIAGTSSNLGGGGGAKSGGKDILMTQETRDVSYNNGKTTERRSVQPGTIRRLTIAAMVQLKPSEPESADPAAATDPAAAVATGPEVTREQVEAIIKQAVGFDPQRSDQIEVLETTLAAATTLAPLADEPAPMSTWMPLVRAVSPVLAAVVALVLGILALRQFRSIQGSREPAGAITPQRARQVSDLIALARKNPEVLGKIMSAWSSEPAGKNETTSNPPRRSAA